MQTVHRPRGGNRKRVQATDGKDLAAPADWRKGDDMIVALSVSTADARDRFGEVEEVFPYLRKIKAPA